MTVDEYVLLSVILTWTMVLTASVLRARGWTLPGLQAAFGNRDDLPEPSALCGRADRAARNMLENMVLFVVAVVGASMAHADGDRLLLSAKIFFWARVAYFPVYLVGVRYLRTAIWSVGVVGIAIIIIAGLRA
jgi:uncharacterized MAPEG superfamily protein